MDEYWLTYQNTRWTPLLDGAVGLFPQTRQAHQPWMKPTLISRIWYETGNLDADTILYLASHTQTCVWIPYSFTFFSHLRREFQSWGKSWFSNLDWPQGKEGWEEDRYKTDCTDCVVKVKDVAVPLCRAVEFWDILDSKPGKEGKLQLYVLWHHLETNWVQMSGLKPLPNISLTWWVFSSGQGGEFIR